MNQRFDIVCCQCGAKDTVPFEPRNPKTMTCASCHKKQGKDAAPKQYAMVCCDCGERSTVPFRPRPGSRLRCKECHAKGGGEKPPKKPFEAKAIPRLEHGTRVHNPIECSKCGRSEILDFVPKGGKPPMCTRCRQEEHGRSWRDLASEAKRTDWEITCVKCGKPDTVPFKPHKDRVYECRNCHRAEDEPEEKPKRPGRRRHRIE
jgi:CxxC-x17-CxxC domain-containing protein